MGLRCQLLGACPSMALLLESTLEDLNSVWTCYSTVHARHGRSGRFYIGGIPLPSTWSLRPGPLPMSRVTLGSYRLLWWRVTLEDGSFPSHGPLRTHYPRLMCGLLRGPSNLAPS